MQNCFSIVGFNVVASADESLYKTAMGTLRRLWCKTLTHRMLLQLRMLHRSASPEPYEPLPLVQAAWPKGLPKAARGAEALFLAQTTNWQGRLGPRTSSAQCVSSSGSCWASLSCGVPASRLQRAFMHPQTCFYGTRQSHRKGAMMFLCLDQSRVLSAEMSDFGWEESGEAV
jgi:hypothetical protein